MTNFTLVPQMIWDEDFLNTTVERCVQPNHVCRLSLDITNLFTKNLTQEKESFHSKKMARRSDSWREGFQKALNKSPHLPKRKIYPTSIYFAQRQNHVISWEGVGIKWRVWVWLIFIYFKYKFWYTSMDAEKLRKEFFKNDL